MDMRFQPLTLTVTREPVTKLIKLTFTSQGEFFNRASGRYEVLKINHQYDLVDMLAEELVGALKKELAR